MGYHQMYAHAMYPGQMPGQMGQMAMPPMNFAPGNRLLLNEALTPRISRLVLSLQA